MSLKDKFDPANYGIFSDSEGLANVSEMDVEQSPDYYSMSRVCEVCGTRKECRVSWAELYCLQYGLNPAAVGGHMGRRDIFDTNWQYDAGLKCFHPGYRCSCLGNPLVVFNMTPTNAETILHKASRNGIISGEQRNIISAASAVVQRMRGVQPRR
jgi:hypothetical protein